MAKSRNSADTTPTGPPDVEPTRLADLDRAERRLTRRAAVALSAMVLSLRLLGFQRTLGWLQRAVRSDAEGGAAALARARRIAALVELANRRCSPLAASCLPRSLALSWLLHRRGIDNELRIGVRTLTGEFQAHAWVEVDGQPLGEMEDVQAVYAAFDLPSRIARLVSE